MTVDYYEILGLDRDASTDAIEAAFARLADENDPERNPDDRYAPERLRLVTAAYETLSDPDDRKAYDVLSAPEDEPAGNGAAPASATAGEGRGDDDTVADSSDEHDETEAPAAEPAPPPPATSTMELESGELAAHSGLVTLTELRRENSAERAVRQSRDAAHRAFDPDDPYGRDPDRLTDALAPKSAGDVRRWLVIGVVVFLLAGAALALMVISGDSDDGPSVTASAEASQTPVGEPSAEPTDREDGSVDAVDDASTPDPCSLWSAGVLRTVTGAAFTDGALREDLSIGQQVICDWVTADDEPLATAQILVWPDSTVFDASRTGDETELSIAGADEAYSVDSGAIVIMKVDDLYLQVAYLPTDGVSEPNELARLAAIAVANL